MLDKEHFQEFRLELEQLLVKHKVTPYLVATIIFNERGPQVEIPILTHVTTDEEFGASEQRLAASFADGIVTGLIRLLMRHNGLTMTQAVGALISCLENAQPDDMAKAPPVMSPPTPWGKQSGGFNGQTEEY